MELTLKQYQERVEKDYRWNFFWMALDNMMFFFIFMGLSPYTVLPYYVQHFTDSSILIGMIPAIYILGNTLPQPFMARFLAGKTTEKNIFWLQPFYNGLGSWDFFFFPSFNLC